MSRLKKIKVSSGLIKSLKSETHELFELSGKTHTRGIGNGQTGITRI